MVKLIKLILFLDLIANIKDPEFNNKTLEDLQVISDESITIESYSDYKIIKITWKPTTPHCKFAVNIGLAIRYALIKEPLVDNLYKIDIILEKESHREENEINKQLNDKERYLSALENENLREYLEKLIN